MDDQIEHLSKELDVSLDIANAVNKSLKDVELVPSFRTNTPIQSQREEAPLEPSESNTSYQLWNHQYMEAPVHQNITEILEDWNFLDDNVRNKRRTSMEDIFKVRHYLNPRSSFSYSSTNVRCWVTVINDISEVPCVVALNSSLRTHESKIILCVIIPNDWDVELPELPFLKFIKLPRVSFECNELTILTLWNHLDFEFCCYLSPYSILQSNIDEILLNEEVFQEIDNETCVFLANETYSNKNEIMFLLFKPSLEIGTVVDEFLKVYSGDSTKLKQLSENDTWDILNTLFGEAWGVVGRDCYYTLHEETDSTNAALVNFRLLKPWIGNKTGINTLWWNMYESSH